MRGLPEPTVHRWPANNLTVEAVRDIEALYDYTALELDPDGYWWLTAWDDE